MAAIDGLSRSAEVFRQILESAPDGIVVVDRESRIVLLNAQAETLFGYSRDALLGQSIDALVPRRFQERHAGHREHYFHDPRVRPMGVGLELYGRRKDGSEFPVEISLSPIATEDGVLVAAAIRDSTERRRIQRMLEEKNVELESANRAKDRFLAAMSHELRTPLNAVIGFTGALLMKLSGPLTDAQEQQLRIVQSSGRHLLSLINDILDLAKIESGKADLQFEPVSVREIVDEVVTTLEPAAHDKNLTLSGTIPDGDVTIATDRRALRQILINLAVNAIKCTEHGFVRIAVQRSQRDGRATVDVNVVDTGIGIAPEDRDRIFRAFEQADPSTTRRFEGAGLGLYLSQELATLLGGRVHFVSSLGSGSTFTLTLPAS